MVVTAVVSLVVVLVVDGDGMGAKVRLLLLYATGTNVVVVVGTLVGRLVRPVFECGCTTEVDGVGTDTTGIMGAVVVGVRVRSTKYVCSFFPFGFICLLVSPFLLLLSPLTLLSIDSDCGDWVG